MRILFTGDWQASVRNLPQVTAIVDQIVGLISSHRIDAVVHTGDLKQVFNPLDVRVTNCLVESVERITALAPMYVNLGNHDRTAPSDSSPSFLPAIRAAGAQVFEQPGAVKLNGGVVLTFVPYIRDPKEQEIAFRKAAPKQHSSVRNILVFHCELAGCKLGAHGDSRNPNAVPVAALESDKYLACFGGHIHNPHLLPPNIWYVGSPFPENWGEANQLKRHLIVDTDRKLSVLSVPSVVRPWLDPTLPGFERFKGRDEYEGYRVRIRVKGDSASETERAVKVAQKKFPGAQIYAAPLAKEAVRPEFTADARVSDRKLISDYLAQTGFNDPRAVPYLMRRISGASTLGLPDVAFGKLEARDVLSFEAVQLDLSEPGLTLVTGRNKHRAGNASNGAGKSSLLALPGLALTGKTTKGQEHDKWRRRGSQGSSWVRQQLILANNRRAEIYRQRNPSRLQFHVDGRDITMGTPAQTQREIQEVTGYSWDVLVNSVYMGQQEVATILTGTDKVRKELFSSFLGLDRYLKAQERVRFDIRKCLEAMDDARATRTMIEQMLGMAERDLASTLALAKPPDSSRMKRLEVRVAQLELELVDLEKASKEAEKKYNLEEKAWHELTKVLAHHQARISIVEEQLRKVRNLGANANCPTCGAKMNRSAMAKLAREFATELATIEKEYKSVQVQYRAAEAVVRSARNERSRTLDAVEEAEKAYNDARRELSRLSEAQKMYDKVRTRATELEQRIAQHRRALRVLRRYLSDLAKDKEFLMACLKVVSRDGLPSYLCATVCPLLNNAAAEYSELFCDNEIRVEFSITDDGDIDVNVINDNGGATAEDQSQGEMRLAALITAFSFRAVLARSNLLILDEPGEGLDATNAAAFAHGLQAVAERFGTVLITTHNPFILSELEPDRHYEVVKEDRVSRLVRIM